jgi:GH35 family endo-1,4-beta-xylanase
LTEVIQNHVMEVVTEVATHYKGKCHAWDVVNEALDEDGKILHSETQMSNCTTTISISKTQVQKLQAL